MDCSIGPRVRTDMAGDRPAILRFVVCGRWRMEFWEVAFARCGVIVSRAVFERFAAWRDL